VLATGFLSCFLSSNCAWQPHCVVSDTWATTLYFPHQLTTLLWHLKIYYSVQKRPSLTLSWARWTLLTTLDFISLTYCGVAKRWLCKQPLLRSARSLRVRGDVTQQQKRWCRRFLWVHSEAIWLDRPCSVERVSAVQLKVHLWSVKTAGNGSGIFSIAKIRYQETSSGDTVEH
jgi:hypothetical protein